MSNTRFKCTEHHISFDSIDKLENHFLIVEHGEFKCFEHERAFDDLDEFNKHLSVLDHLQEGIAPCKKCGKSVEYSFTGKLVNGLYKPTCGECLG